MLRRCLPEAPTKVISLQAFSLVLCSFKLKYVSTLKGILSMLAAFTANGNCAGVLASQQVRGSDQIGGAGWGTPVILYRMGLNKDEACRPRRLLTTAHSSVTLPAPSRLHKQWPSWLFLVLTSILGKAGLVGVQESGRGNTNLFCFPVCLRRSLSVASQITPHLGSIKTQEMAFQCPYLKRAGGSFRSCGNHNS